MKTKVLILALALFLAAAGVALARGGGVAPPRWVLGGDGRTEGADDDTEAF